MPCHVLGGRPARICPLLDLVLLRQLFPDRSLPEIEPSSDRPRMLHATVDSPLKVLRVFDSRIVNAFFKLSLYPTSNSDCLQVLRSCLERSWLQVRLPPQPMFHRPWRLPLDPSFLSNALPIVPMPVAVTATGRHRLPLSKRVPPLIAVRVNRIMDRTSVRDLSYPGGRCQARSYGQCISARGC